MNRQSIVENSQLKYATGRERKDDGKPCVTSVTLTLFKKTFLQTSPCFKQVFRKRPENTNVK